MYFECFFIAFYFYFWNRSKNLLKFEIIKFFSQVQVFANTISIKISRVFNFAKLTKIRENRENWYPRKLVPVRYALFVLKMICLVRHILIKQTKIICVENILKRISGENCWQCSFKPWSDHCFSNQLGLARNSFKRYTIPIEKKKWELLTCAT